MRKYLLSALALALVVAQPALAQDKEKDKDKEKSKMESNEEIIIKRKSDKDSKVTIEIKGDDVIVNGKSIDEYDDDDVAVQKRKSKGVTIYSPFRGQGGGAMSFEGHPFNLNDDIPFFGVATEKHEKGARIDQVTDNSSAEKAGLRSGDIITKLDDTKISGPDDLTRAIRQHKPDDKITITYERDGKTATVPATIGKRKNFDFVAPPMNLQEFKWDYDNNYPRAFTITRGRLGIKAQDTEDEKGVKVIDVEDESIAEKAGVKEDDVITEFDGKKVSSADELSRYAREARDKASVTIKVNRNGKSQTIELKTPRKLKTANL